MKHLIINLLTTCFLTLLTVSVGAADLPKLSSPSTGLQVELTMASKVPYLIVKDGAGRQMAKVRLGLRTSASNFTSGMTFVSATEPEAVTERYEALHGKRSSVSNAANKTVITLANTQGDELAVEVRAYEDGVVFRYQLTGDSQLKRTFTAEATAYQIASKAHRWLQPFNTSYEADFPYQATGGKTGTWGYPALFEQDDTFFLITEANIGRSYSSTHLDNSANAQQYQISYPFDYEGYNVGATTPTWTGDWTGPWRVMIIGSLGTVVESTLVEDVSEPCAIAKTDFVQPGRAAWIYWAFNHSSKDYQICTKYVDLAVEMGWEYVLIDWEWEQMSNGGSVEDAVRYATRKGVKPLLWYHSNDGKIQNASQRKQEFAWLKRIGVKGVKIDFFESDKQHTMQYFADILEDAAKYQLLVNFHGCTIPRGWSRTYPHLMSQEAVFGAEQYNNGGTMTTEGARINCLLTYTRNVVGPMDYTPVAFTDSQHPHTTTFAHELALSVAFESGIQHWADRPEGFQALPLMAKRHMMQVPVAWDETRFVDGYPGKSFIVARRKGSCWYVAALNGLTKAASFDIPLTFLGEGAYTVSCIADGSEARQFRFSTHTLSRDSQFHIDCLGRGGCVLILQNGNTEDSPVGVSEADFNALVQETDALIAAADGHIGYNTGSYRQEAVDELRAARQVCSDVLAGSEVTAGQRYAAYQQLLAAYSNFQEGGSAEGGLITLNNKLEDITREYLLESRNFSRVEDGTSSEGTTRFGLLAAPWVVTENIINQDNGTHGGFDGFEGGRAISVEKWDGGEPAMVNDKIYQTSSQALPAGSYHLHISVTCRSGLDNGKCLLRVARGSELPNKGVTKNVLATYDMGNTAYSGEYDVCSFKLTQPEQITLGWVLNVPQNEGGHAFRVTAIRLIDSSGNDVSADYLSNYENIQRCDRAYVRYGQPVNWQVADYYIPAGNDGTKQGTDNYPGYDCLALGVWGDARKAEGDLANARLYRQVTLPAGRYVFCAAYEAVYQLRSAFMFAAVADTETALTDAGPDGATKATVTVGALATTVPDAALATTVTDASASGLPPTAAETATAALAFYPLPGTPTGDDFYGIYFTLEHPTTLYLGWNADLTTPSQQEFRVKALRLLRDTTYDPVGIIDLPQTPQAAWQKDGDSGSETAAAPGFQNKWFDLSGHRVANPAANLNRGVYIVNGQKIAIR